MSSLASKSYTHVDGESLNSQEAATEYVCEARVAIVSPRCARPLKDGLVAEYDEHEDSVYAIDWSTVDPWVFASLSYDGRFVINRVPNEIKFKIQ